MIAKRPSEAFREIRVIVPAERAEWVSAEAFAAGASGLEERASGARTELLIYATADVADAVRAAAALAAGADAEIASEAVVAQDWPEIWKRGLAPLVVSERLAVSSRAGAVPPRPGRVELVIEPRQAFGTGAHGSTSLALAALDARLVGRAVERVLDVGSGSGVLAIAALRLGAGAALACDLDPIAARETRENATRNGVAVASFAGSLAALGPRAGRFGLVIANLISSEMFPILDALVDRVDGGGVLILSGLLAAERAAVEAALAERAFETIEARSHCDERGDDWLALTATPRSAGASRRAAGRG